jgi:hypothetical protein
MKHVEDIHPFASMHGDTLARTPSCGEAGPSRCISLRDFRHPLQITSRGARSRGTEPRAGTVELTDADLTELLEAARGDQEPIPAGRMGIAVTAPKH